MTEKIDICKIEKKSLRKKMREKLSTLDPVTKAFESAELCLRFIQSAAYKSARVIFGFMPLKDEVDILPILRAAIADEKKILLPKIDGSKMDFHFVKENPIEETEAGAHGIFEPKPSCEKADIAKIFEEFCGEEIIVLVPGLAFTKEGFRLGRGGGYYDRFLERLSGSGTAGENAKDLKRRAKTVGVCYGAQIAESVPHEEHDARVDTVLSASN